MAMILCPMVLILLRRELQPTRKTQGRSEKVKKKKCHLRDHHGIMIGEQFALWIPRENRERIVCFFLIHVFSELDVACGDLHPPALKA